jgi:hypothetical protein
MKKQIGVLVLTLALVQMANAAITALEIAKRSQETVTVDALRGRSKEAIQVRHSEAVKSFSKVSGSSADIVANNLARRPELAETYVAMMIAERSTDASDKAFLADAKTIMSNFGTAKGVDKMTQQEVEVARKESASVVKFVEILPLLESYGDKAVAMRKSFADQIKNGATLNKALRTAATEVLGLKGRDLDTFMQDPANGLGSCKK